MSGRSARRRRSDEGRLVTHQLRYLELILLISDMIDQTLKNEKAAKTAARKKQRKVLFVGELIIAHYNTRRTHKCVGVQGKGERFRTFNFTSSNTRRSTVNLARALS
jgi:hypothetical protein